MAELQNPDPLVEAVAKARKEASRRPELLRPTGSSLNIINGHAYLYGGSISATSTETNILEFSTGAEAVKGLVQFQYNVASEGDDFLYQAYINDVLVDGCSATGSSDPENASPRYILVPPYSYFRFTAQNESGATGREQLCHFIGRII